MTEYINMWKNYVNFSDRTSVKGYWMAVLFNFLAGLVLGILSLFIGDLPMDIYGLAVLVPSVALTVRRLRDAGKAWYFIFLPIIPIVGGIILIVFLCKGSEGDETIPVV